MQGAGAALIAPSALTLLMMLVRLQPRRSCTKALAFYGAAAPAGGTAGVFLGGVITECTCPGRGCSSSTSRSRSSPWRRHRGLMPPHRRGRGSVDVWGAITVTAGIGAAVYGIVRAPEVGWASVQTWAVLGRIGRAARRVRRHPGAAPPAAGAAVDLPHAEPGRRQRRAVPARRGLDPDVVLPQPVPAAGARIQRLPSGAALLPMTVADHDRDDRRRPPRDRPVRAQGHGRHRNGRAGRRDGLAVVRPRQRDVLGRRPAGVAGRRRGHVAGVHPVPGYRHLQRAPPQEGGLAAGIVNTSYQIGSAIGLAAITAVAATPRRQSDREPRRH